MTVTKMTVERPREYRRDLGVNSRYYSVNPPTQRMKCYTCDEEGHLARDCPRNRASNARGRDRGRGARTTRSTEDRSSSARRSSSANSRENATSRGINRGRGASQRGGSQRRGSFLSRGRGHDGNQRERRGNEAPRGRARGGKSTPQGKTRSRSNTPRGRGTPTSRRSSVDSRSSLKSNKSDKAKKVAFEDASKKVCYNCAETGHISKDCKNPKGIKEKQSPWPQKKQLDEKVTRISRDKVEWSTKELAAIKEYVRVTECLIDMKAQTAKVLKKKELTAKMVKKTVTTWNKATNVKVEKIVELTNLEYLELETHATQLLVDIAETTVLRTTMESELLILCENTTRDSIGNFHLTAVVAGELATEVLKEIKTASDASRDLRKTRIRELAQWLQAVKQETIVKQRKHIVDEVMMVIDKDAKKKAAGAAENLLMKDKPQKEKEPSVADLSAKSEARLAVEQKVISELATTMGSI